MKSLIRQSRGFTLIELMIGLVLGLILIAGLVAIFSNLTKGFRQDEQSARLHDDLRLAFAVMAEDVEMAGFWSDLHDPFFAVVPDCNLFGLSSASACDSNPSASPAVTGNLQRWTYFNRAPVATMDNFVTGTEGSSLLTSGTTPDVNDPESISLTDLGFVPGEVRPNTDIIAIKRLNGAQLAVAGLVTSNAYLQSGSGGTATLFRKPAGAPAPVPLVTPRPMPPYSSEYVYYAYRVAVYFIRTYAVTEGDEVPTLCRKVLQGNAFATECLSQGIENLQLEYGVDTVPALGDGVVDQYIATPPTQAQLQRVVAVRISMLGQSQSGAKGEVDGTYKNAKTYTLGNITVAGGNDAFYRKLLQGVVLVRNPRSLNALAR